MPIVIRCGSCEAAFRVRDEFAGKRGKCPKCGAIFLAPVSDVSANELTADTSTPAAEQPAPPEPTWPDFTADAVLMLGSSERPGRTTAGSKKKSKLVSLLAFAAAAVVLLSIAGVTVYQSQQVSPKKTPTQAQLDPELRRKAQGRGPRTEGFVPKPVEKLDLKKPGPGASTEDIIAYVDHGIVKIDVYDEFNNRRGLGSGFVIDNSGLIATNYHVVDDAVKAEVQFSDGIRYGVEGYMALRPESDVVILKLNGTPPNMQALDLHFEGQPRTAAQVYCIGHPLGYEFQVTNGIVSRVLKTSQFPADTQNFLKSGLGDKVDNLWISHTAQISPGNSGGPLLNSQGEVVGVNSWVNQQINLGYAVHVGALHEMLQNLFPSPHPLRDHRRPPPTLSQVGAQWGIEVTAERLKEIASQLAATNYACTSPQDYAKLQELALAMTYVLHLRADPEDRDEQQQKTLPGLAAEADAIVATLKSTPWNPVLIKPINAQASAKIGERLEGAFVFGTIQRVLEGQEGARRGVLVQLLEDEQVIFVPLTSALKEFQPAVGANFLIVGISYGKSLPYGDNPLEPKSAPIVLTETFIELPAGAVGADSGASTDAKPDM